VGLQRAWLDLQTQLTEDDGVVASDDALLLMAEDLGEVAAHPWYDEGVGGVGCGHSETPVVRREVDLRYELLAASIVVIPASANSFTRRS
jgi:hypothetical protein